MSEPRAHAEKVIGDSDRAAFEAAYTSLSGPLSRYARTILGSSGAERVNDVLQDAWMRAWMAWPPENVASPDGWLFRIVRNCCMDQHRRRRREPNPVASSSVEIIAVDDPAGDAELRETVRLLDGLPAVLRETMWLRAVEDRSYAEIAAIQSVPIGTVMSRLHAGRSRLAKKLHL